MKPPPFEYHRVETIEQALETLDQAGEDAKVLAGGQSLTTPHHRQRQKRQLPHPSAPPAAYAAYTLCPSAP